MEWNTRLLSRFLCTTQYNFVHFRRYDGNFVYYFIMLMNVYVRHFSVIVKPESN